MNIKELTAKYLAWCKIHRSAGTLTWYSGHLNSFLEYPGIAETDAMSLKPFQIVEWVDSHETWGNNHKRGAIVAVQRLYNWAVDMGYLDVTPLKKVTKPPASRREIYMKPEDFEAVLATIPADSTFRDFVLFMWFSGCRPQEARAIEPRHVELHNQRIVFPVLESKGKRSKRVIYLQGAPLEIITRLLAECQPGDKLFKNERGQPWTKWAICSRYGRISKQIGKRMFSYASRHGFGTRKLKDGYDAMSIAAIMGHCDGSMLAKIYSHMDQEVDHLKLVLAEKPMVS